MTQNSSKNVLVKFNPETRSSEVPTEYFCDILMLQISN